MPVAAEFGVDVERVGAVEVDVVMLSLPSSTSVSCHRCSVMSVE